MVAFVSFGFLKTYNILFGYKINNSGYCPFFLFLFHIHLSLICSRFFVDLYHNFQRLPVVYTTKAWNNERMATFDGNGGGLTMSLI